MLQARSVACLAFLSWIAVGLAQPAAGQAVAVGAQTAPQAASLPVETSPDYVLGPGDKIRVITFGEESLTGEFLVDGTGETSLPLIGTVKAGGLTVDQFRTEVEGALREGYLKDPRVSVEVEDYRPFYILGEVNKPGEYPYTSQLTVLNAVAEAAGFTYRANTRRVFIKGVHDTSEHVVPLTSATPVAPGDTIRIGERFF